MSREDHNMGMMGEEPVLIVAEDSVVRTEDGLLVMGTEAWNNLVSPAGLEPALHREADFKSAASTNSAKGTYPEDEGVSPMDAADTHWQMGTGMYHGLKHPRNHAELTEEEKEEYRKVSSIFKLVITPEQLNIRRMWPKHIHDIRGGFRRRLTGIRGTLRLPNGWSPEFYFDTRGYWYLQVEDHKAIDNVTGEPCSWKGRKWLISKHMTDGEIVQTVFKAVMTAAEHELREAFMFNGQPIFDPHYDLDKLVALRSSKNALQERSSGTTVVPDDTLAKDPIRASHGAGDDGRLWGSVPDSGNPRGLTSSGTGSPSL
jgi:hypothetical protein